ncbi:MAG: hypothetical protein HDR00_02640 [Lachnospiraceae bacterium]|nr:hypothetical protein [Lachnospiraceae bacterium]
MKKRSWKEKVQYQIDNIMSKGTIALIGLLFGITLIVVGVAGIVAVIFGAEGGLGSQIWASAMHVLDAGTLTADTLDSIPYIVIMSLVTLCGLFVTSILIGIITTGFESKLKELRKGKSTVLEERHTVIIGFNDNVYTLLNELIEANSNHKNQCIVVVGTQEKEEMEEAIASRISDFKTSHVICRSGSLSEAHILERCSVERSRSVIINVYDDAEVIKIILSISAYLKDKELLVKDLFMTAAIEEEQNVEAARIAGEGRAEIIYANDAISRIIAHTCRQPGLSNVLVELFDYDGDELYFEEIPELYGKTLHETLNLFPKAVVFGIRKEDGPHMNPPMDTVVEEGDLIILLEDDDGSFELDLGEVSLKEELIINTAAKRTANRENLLVLGCNNMIERILEEYDCYVEKGSKVTIVYPEKLELDKIGCRNIEISQVIGSGTNRKLLEELLLPDIDDILVLSNDDLDPEASDAQTLLQLIFLRDISQKMNRRFTITSEMRRSNNQRLASQVRVEDFVIGSNIVNLLMTQIAENRELTALFEDILDEEGSEIYMKPASEYVKTGVPVDFYTVTESAARKGHIAIGYKKIRDGVTEIVTNPLKSEQTVYEKEDYMIVIAED